MNTEIMKKAVAYYRVSTERQGKSGLGLYAQKEIVHSYIKGKQIKLVTEYIEVESGKNNKRPILQEALNYCQENNTLLIIAKLDRFGRNVAFISALMEKKIRFVAADNPEANHLVLHILAAVAQYEREQISSRTKAALAAAKKRGVKLGKHGKILAKRNKQKSLQFARIMKPHIINLRKEGFHTVQAITDELNRRKVKPYREGGRWHKSTVFNLMRRISRNIK